MLRNETPVILTASPVEKLSVAFAIRLVITQFSKVDYPVTQFTRLDYNKTYPSKRTPQRSERKLIQGEKSSGKLQGPLLSGPADITVFVKPRFLRPAG